MPLTPTSATTSYLTPLQFLSDGYVDPRWVADKISVDGRRVGAISGDPGGAVNVATVASHPTVQKILNRASGKFEAALLKGNRYQVADIQALAGTVAQDFVFNILAGLAKGMFMQLRPEPGVADMPEFLEAMDWLAALASGERILPFQETQDAGLISDAKDTPDTVQIRNGVTADARKFFGRRNNQEWPWGGW